MNLYYVIGYAFHRCIIAIVVPVSLTVTTTFNIPIKGSSRRAEQSRKAPMTMRAVSLVWAGAVLKSEQRDDGVGLDGQRQWLPSPRLILAGRVGESKL